MVRCGRPEDDPLHDPLGPAGCHVYDSGPILSGERTVYEEAPATGAGDEVTGQEPMDLATAVDLLWGWMPSEQVKEIVEDQPELAELCRKVHHDLWHGTTHEERMMRRG